MNGKIWGIRSWVGMKRLALFMVLVFGLSGVSLAENLDFSNMSTDELLEMRENIDSEIGSRVYDDVSIIYPGTYIVGRDLKAGSYLLTYMQDVGEYSYAEFGVFDTEDNYKEVYDYNSTNNFREYSIYYGYLTDPGEQGYIDLKDDYILYIAGTGLSSIVPVTPSWKLSD